MDGDGGRRFALAGAGLRVFWLVSEYQTVFRAAKQEAEKGDYKEAYNALGQVLEHEGPEDHECRHLRGKYALQVGQLRLDNLGDAPDRSQTLIKAACWLARSEAYLMSATEGASGAECQAIQADLSRNREQQERFRQLCREVGLDLFS